MNFENIKNKRAQVTIFIIIAIVIVAGIIFYFTIGFDFAKSVPADLQPVYDYYLECVKATTRESISIMGEQGGYLEIPDFEPGSAYSPFSSQLDFLGRAVPYWMYVSGNNILREQVPTKTLMEEQLARDISEKSDLCDFSGFNSEGYIVNVEKGAANVKINNLDVVVSLDSVVSISRGMSSANVETSKVTVNSKLGKFHDLALKIYELEKKEAFLENYALDVLRTSAPVTGIDLGCAPKVFVESEIREDISKGLEANIASVKIDGGYYELSNQERNYFVVDSGLNIDENLNFMYSSSWPTRIEIYGDKIAEPIGLQEGLGILGFCYVPYNLVYDMNFPVLVQLYDTEELFQFPVATIVQRNQKREAILGEGVSSIESPICDFKNQKVDVYTYDLNLNPVEALISFECLNSVCSIGETKVEDSNAHLVADFPQCVNGYITARAQGYADSKFKISTNVENIANILLNKKHNVSLDLGNVKKALITFSSDDYSTTVVYPEMKSIELIESYYNVSVYVYENSSLSFPKLSERKCVDVTEGGIAGFFGATTERCYDIEIPKTDVSFAVVGGGKTQEYILDSVLKQSRELNINVPLFKAPTTLQELQMNHERVDGEKVVLSFE